MTATRTRKMPAEDKSKYHVAYVFERFPSFTQTFCVREVLELERQGLRPLLFSIRDTRQESVRHFPEALVDRVHYLPQEKELSGAVQEMKQSGLLPQSAILTLRHWGEGRADKRRVQEAAYIGVKMREAGVRHAHTHFAGVGARTCCWLKRFFGGTFSFTGHANDIFCDDEGSEVPLERLMRDASLVATVSDYTAGDLRARFPFAASKVKRVYNGLDLNKFSEAKFTQLTRKGRAGTVGRKKILSVGRLIEKKGFDELIAASARLKSGACEAEFEIVIVGDGPLEDELKRQIAELDVEDCVTLAGPKSQEEIATLLGESDLFVLPCVTERGGGKDNLPTVIMEAMAAAVPCVSTRLAGVPEMIAHGETGLLVGERDTEALARAMSELLSDPERCRRMGDAGAVLAERRFAQEITARSLRRQMAARGLVRFDAKLIAGDGLMASAYVRQLSCVRLPRLFRPQRQKVAYLEGGEVVAESKLAR